MIITEQFSRDPSVVKMIQFEKIDSFHPKTVVSQLKMKYSFIGAILPIRDCGQR